LIFVLKLGAERKASVKLLFPFFRSRLQTFLRCSLLVEQSERSSNAWHEFLPSRSTNWALTYAKLFATSLAPIYKRELVRLGLQLSRDCDSGLLNAIV